MLIFNACERFLNFKKFETKNEVKKVPVESVHGLAANIVNSDDRDKFQARPCFVAYTEQVLITLYLNVRFI